MLIGMISALLIRNATPADLCGLSGSLELIMSKLLPKHWIISSINFFVKVHFL